MNTTTAFAQPPERRRCSRTLRPNRRARNESNRPSNRANGNEHAPTTRMHIVFHTAPPDLGHSFRDPDWTLKGGTV